MIAIISSVAQGRHSSNPRRNAADGATGWCLYLAILRRKLGKSLFADSPGSPLPPGLKRRSFV
jgi:hypothetical protein